MTRPLNLPSSAPVKHFDTCCTNTAVLLPHIDMSSLCTQHAHMHTVSMCRNTHKAHLSSSSLYTCLLFLIMHKHFSEAASPAATLRLEWNVLTAFADGWLNWDGAGNKQLKVPRCRLTFCSFIMKPKKKMKKKLQIAPRRVLLKVKKKKEKISLKMWLRVVSCGVQQAFLSSHPTSGREIIVSWQ